MRKSGFELLLAKIVVVTGTAVSALIIAVGVPLAGTPVSVADDAGSSQTPPPPPPPAPDGHPWIG